MSTPVALEQLAARVPDGAKLAVPVDYAGVAVAATFALVRRGVRNLHLVCVPTSSIQADILIGAGCVATLETSAVSLGEFGPAPRFTEAVRQGAIRLLDATCPAVYAALQAAEKGIPFMPLRGILGSDLLRSRPDWQVQQNPFSATPDPIVLLPALQPDIALFHAPVADRDGNVFIGRRRELMTMAHAARQTLVTVERIQEESLLASEASAAGVLPALYVDAVAEARRGAWPLNLWDIYGVDEAAMADYAQAAASADGFRRWLDRQIARPAAA